MSCCSHMLIYHPRLVTTELFTQANLCHLVIVFLLPSFRLSFFRPWRPCWSPVRSWATWRRCWYRCSSGKDDCTQWAWVFDLQHPFNWFIGYCRISQPKGCICMQSVLALKECLARKEGKFLSQWRYSSANTFLYSPRMCFADWQKGASKILWWWQNSPLIVTQQSKL